MKSYYLQLKPHVLKHTKRYITDLTVHDKKALRGYTGEFIYGYRDSGTNIFLIDPYFKSLNEVLNTGKSNYFTERGLRNVIRAELTFREILDVMAIDPIFTGLENEKFIVGKNGNIRHVTTKTMLNIIAELDHKSFLLQMEIRRKHYHTQPSYAA